MIKIEVTGHSIAEVSDKLLAIGASLQRDVAKKEVAEAAPADPTPAPKSVPAAEISESPQTTEEPSTIPAPAASTSELNFDTDVAPVVLRVVKDKGKPVAQEILAQFGVEKASNLDPSRWPELVAALQDAL